jgi:phospholipid-transporting ATPase
MSLILLSETNLKIKQASPQTSDLTSPSLVTALHGSLRSEHPNNSLYTYEGSLDLITSAGFPKQVPLGPDQMLLRGAQIRNTSWAYGLVVFTGHETKLMRNATWVVFVQFMSSAFADGHTAQHQSNEQLSRPK